MQIGASTGGLGSDRGRWHDRWDSVVLTALGALHLVLSMTLVPSALLMKYPLLAQLARAGRLSGEDGSTASPLYLLLHTFLSPVPIRWIQVAAALGSMVLIYRIGRRVADHLTGLISAGVFALATPVLIYGATLEPDLLLMAACLLGVWAVPDIVDQPRKAVLFGAGMGLAVALRPTAALIAGILLVGIVAGSIRGEATRGSWRNLATALIATALFALGPLLGVRGLYSSPAGGAMSPGTAFYDGNRPESIGLGVVNPWLVKVTERQQGLQGALPDAAHGVYRRFARLSGGPEMTLGETQAWWAGKSWAFALLEPVAFSRGLLNKGLFLLAGTEYHDVEDVRLRSEALSRLPLLRYRWVLWLGLAGILLMLGHRRMPWWIWGYWAGGAAAVLVFSVTSRYTMAFLPAMVLFAGAFLTKAIRIRSWLSGGLLGLCLGLAWLPNLAPAVRWDSRIQERVVLAHQQLEGLLGSRSQMTRTMTSYAAAQAYFPFMASILDTRGIPFESPRIAGSAARASEILGTSSPPDAYLQAVLFKEAGDCDSALPLAVQSGKAGFFTTDYSRLLDPYLLEAECLLAAGDTEGAMAAVVSSLERRPATADGLAMAIAGARATGSFPARVPGWEERLSRIHDPLSAGFALTRSYRLWGEADTALQEARGLSGLLPESAVVNYEIALLLAQQGQDHEAYETLQEARSSFPGLPLPLSPFAETFDRLLSEDPGDRQVWLARIDGLAQAGEFGEAARVVGEAAEFFPGDEGFPELQAVMSRLASQIGG